MSDVSAFILIADHYLRCSLVAISLLMLLEISDALQSILSLSAFKWLGKHSFGMYLLHTIFQGGIMMHLKVYFSSIDMMDSAFVKPALLYIITFVVMTPTCLIFTRVFDEGSVHIGRYVTAHDFSPQSTSAAYTKKDLFRFFRDIRVSETSRCLLRRFIMEGEEASTISSVLV